LGFSVHRTVATGQNGVVSPPRKLHVAANRVGPTLYRRAGGSGHVAGWRYSTVSRARRGVLAPN
jgi:hypothetical protein